MFFLPGYAVKKQRAKTKSRDISVNGLPSRVRSNGLVESDISVDVADTTKRGTTVSSKAKKKLKSAKHNKVDESTVDVHCKTETATENQVEICDFYYHT